MHEDGFVLVDAEVSVLKAKALHFNTWIIVKDSYLANLDKLNLVKRTIL